jgi:hypothetical protein
LVVYMYFCFAIGDPSIKRGRVGIPWNSSTRLHFCVCPKPGPTRPHFCVCPKSGTNKATFLCVPSQDLDIQCLILSMIFLCVQWFEVRDGSCFVPIGRIVGHLCLNFLFKVSDVLFFGNVHSNHMLSCNKEQ